MTGTASPDRPTHEDSFPITNGRSSPVDSELSSLSSTSVEDLAELLEAESSERQNTRQNYKEEAHEATDIQDVPTTNGHVKETNGVSDDTKEAQSPTDPHPAKRRKVRETTPTGKSRLPKPESPPWKKIEAEGPSSFTENGMRKSGRINHIPLELQRGDKRITRRSLHAQELPASKSKLPMTNGHATHTAQPLKASTGAGKGASSKTTSATSRPPSSRKSIGHETRSMPKTRRRSSPPPAHRQPSPKVGTRRSSRRVRESLDYAHDISTPSQGARSPPDTRTTPRIKLRLRPPLTELPVIHPEQAKGRPKLGPSPEEYFLKAAGIPVEDGGQFASEEGPHFDEDMAQREALTIMRIEDEVQPGGLLTEERCSAFEPEAAEEPPRQWAHMDHMVKAMANFRKLMLMEQQRHRATAKKLAEACRDAWHRKQPKTAEELEREAQDMWRAKYRVVVRALVGTWENVRVEINRRRLEEWEAAEQRRVKAALQEAVNLSEQKLLARQAQFDSDMLSDEEGEDNSSDDEDDMDSDSALGSGSGSENGSNDDEDEDMSASSSEDDEHKSVASDEGLTQEQLRAKYANLPPIEPEAADAQAADAVNDEKDGTGDADDDDTSDESIDMDDDLGSTDMGSDDDDGSEGDGEESDDEAEEPSGLLGLFFGKKELKKIQDEAVAEESNTNDTDMADAEDTPRTDDAAIPETDSVSADQPKLSGEVQESVTEEAVAMDVDTAAGDALADDHENDISEGVSALGAPSTAAVSVAADDETTTLSQPPIDVVNGATVSSMPSPSRSVDLVKDEVMNDASQHIVPDVEITAPSSQVNQTSPDTEPVTNTASPERSQSPRTSDSKPSEVDTMSSAELLSVPKETSRSASPQPNAPKTEIPFLLRGTLREYQHYGLDWLAGLYANNTNGILADEMGLGKTIQTIALLAHLACQHEVWGPHLVIVPTSVMLNWEMEFKKWCPGFKILTYYGTQEERKRKRQGWTNDDIWNVCITSYQIVLQDQQVFKRRRWHYMILDEAHNIKNFRSQRWQTLLGFNTHSRLLLTGTPLQNNLTELWSLLFFLMPSENGVGGFADLKEFHDWFQKPESQILESGREQMDDEARAIISKLHKVLRPYLLRRLKADVEKQMPAKHEHVEFCRLSKRQRELYDGFLARTDTRDTLSSGNYLSIINCLMQLRKVCNHPDLFIDRPIMTSFRMDKSVAVDYEVTERVVRRRLLAEPLMSTVSLGFMNLIPTQHENLSDTVAERISQLSSHRVLADLRATQQARWDNASHDLDPATVESNIVYLESAARWGRYEELQHCVYVNALRRQRRPIYGQRLRDLLTIGADKRPYKPKPRVPKQVMSWFEDDSFLVRSIIPTLDQRAASMEGIISKFACVTPAVVTRDLDRIILGRRAVEAFEDTDLKLSAPIKHLPFTRPEPPVDPWHEARMRLSIQFPDKRLLQYDCGKLQALDKLLRKLQAGGHRALIFTQMTKVLDILEQFLNIHGHKYLRLDGATKVEQRQILTDRFNVDTRILCFILSTRSGGLGLNLTGADTVIFYDQDWNPAMDKQCQDRCHRIGQTRDVHIYRLISEHTIEANILRKASQKQMLDDVVIQEGEFTTDYFNKMPVRDVIGNNAKADPLGEGDAAANAAMDRILGGVETSDQRTATRALEHAEDTEDIQAARAAEKEIQQDDADFTEKSGGGTGSGVSSARQTTPREGSAAPATLGKSNLGLFTESADDSIVPVEEVEVEHNAWGEHVHNIDDYMLKTMAAQLEGTALELPKDKKKSKKKGKNTRRR